MNGSDRFGHPVGGISALIDGELRGAERETVEAHLADCASCRALLEDLRNIARAVPELAGPEMPEGFEALVKARLRAEPDAPRRRRFVLPVAVAATLGALALVATVQLQRGKPLPEVAQSPTAVSEGDAADDTGKSTVDEPSDAKEKSNEGIGLREEKSVAPPEPSFRQQAAATESAKKDGTDDMRAGAGSAPSAPPAAPPLAPPPEPPAEARSDRERFAQPPALQKAPADEPVDEAADQEQFAPLPPPPPSPPPAPRAERKRERTELRAPEKQARLAPSGVAGGLADRPVSARDVLHCPAPWKVPAEASWQGAESSDPLGILSTIAAYAGGEAVPGRDERGPFATLRLPATAWPGIVERLRGLGATVPAELPPLPSGTVCVQLDVRLPDNVPR